MRYTLVLYGPPGVLCSSLWRNRKALPLAAHQHVCEREGQHRDRLRYVVRPRRVEPRADVGSEVATVGGVERHIDVGLAGVGGLGFRGFMGLGIRVWGLGFEGFGVQGLGGLGSGDRGLRSRVLTWLLPLNRRPTTA